METTLKNQALYWSLVYFNKCNADTVFIYLYILKLCMQISNAECQVSFKIQLGQDQYFIYVTKMYYSIIHRFSANLWSSSLYTTNSCLTKLLTLRASNWSYTMPVTSATVSSSLSNCCCTDLRKLPKLSCVTRHPCTSTYTDVQPEIIIHSFTCIILAELCRSMAKDHS
jgi:hypothetical protein